MLEIRVLGQFEVRMDGQPVEIPSRPAQSLLAYLLLNPGTPHRREKLAGLLWPDAPELNARNNLRQALWRIRQAIETNRRVFLLPDQFSIAFDPQSEYWLDASLLVQEVSEECSADELIGVVSVYRGELLPGFFDEWIALERERLQAVIEHKMQMLLERLVAEQRWTEVLDWGERWIALGQTPEPAYRALMAAHSAFGDVSKVASDFERCVQALRSDLGVDPSEQTRALYAQLSRGEMVLGRSPTRMNSFSPQPIPPDGSLRGSRVSPDGTAAPSPEPTLQLRTANLSVPLTSFIGREQEIGVVKRLLSTIRLLTLTGAGGSGKTRLAIRVSTDLVADRLFPDGVWWVELATLTDAGLVPRAVASTLDVEESPLQPLSQTLVQYLRSRNLLLVLDNCEHLIATCAQLAEDWLSACPNLKILATSREALGITGESVWQVPTLSLPDPHHWPPSASLMQYEGIRLFVERAVAVKFDFALTEQNALAVAQLCQRLDGIPLAIELAAARIKVLSPEEIGARLDDRFTLLTMGSRTALPRHQTLRATMDWSYGLLTEPERILFRRLSVFVGGFTLPGAEAVTAVSNVLELLTHLIDKSLAIVDDQSTETRYRLLETVREYAWGKLGEAGEVDAVRRRHLKYCLKLAEEAEPKLFSAEQLVWLNRLETEHDNLRVAIQWSLESGEAEAGLRLTAALRYFWWERGHHSEGLERLKQVLSRLGVAERTAARAKALNAAGFTLWSQSNQTAARPLLEEALAIGRELGDKWIIAMSLQYLGRVATGQGDYAAAWSFFEEGLVIWRELGPQGKHGTGWSLTFLGDVALDQGDHKRAQALYEEAVSLLRELGDKNLFSYALRRLGQVVLYQGDYRRATALCKESLTLNRELGHEQAVGACLAGLAGVAIARGQALHSSRRYDDLQYAAQLFGAVQVFLDTISTLLLHLDHIEYDRNVAALHAHLDQAAFETAWATGRAMTMEQASTYALENI